MYVNVLAKRSLIAASRVGTVRNFAVLNGKHVPQMTKVKNVFVAAGLVGFVTFVYYYSVSKVLRHVSFNPLNFIIDFTDFTNV